MNCIEGTVESRCLGRKLKIWIKIGTRRSQVRRILMFLSRVSEMARKHQDSANLRPSRSQNLDVFKQSVRDGQKIIADLIAGHFIRGDTQQGRRTVSQEKESIESTIVIFWSAPKSIGELGHEPDAPRTRLVGMKNVRPGTK